jgi:hypothetical protein
VETPHNLQGIDYKVRAYLDAYYETIEKIEVWKWNGSDFDVSVNVVSYGLGIQNGYQYNLENADVIEFIASRADLGNPQGPMKIVYHASINTLSPPNDYTGAFYYPQMTFGVPMFSQAGIIILFLLLALSATLIIRRRQASWLKVMCALFSVLILSGISWANLVCPEIICLDGLTEDWHELAVAPSVTDAVGDSSASDDGEDIVAGYITSDANSIYFRIDIVGGGDPPDICD